MSLFLVLALATLVGCKNDVAGPDSDATNLVANPSFEVGDLPSFAGWHLRDTIGIEPFLDHFAEDVPVLGGSWSLKLTPLGPSEIFFADYYVVGPSERAVYRASAWAKANGTADGAVQFRIFSAIGDSLRASNAVTADTWQLHALEDTLRLYDGDTLVLRLVAHPNLGYDAVLFDEVKLERIR